ncbi:MAG: hypothetical protein HZB52_05770 [Chloroflexi bacterium]|nr:hypothetical protein [Chloroflexota bacterium]
MDIFKLLQSAEETIYEIATWFALLPKTLLQVLFKPQWIQSYVTGEWTKESPQRFKDFLSPVLFWVFVAVTPMFGVLDSIPILKSWAFNSKSILAVIILIGMPVLYAVILQKAGERVIEKESLMRLFYLQCLPCAILQCSLAVSSISIAPNFGFLQPLCGQLNTVLFIWFLIAETLIFKKELDTQLARAIIWATLALIACALALIAVLLAMAFIGYIPTQSFT